MRIAICDDDGQELARLSGLVGEYQLSRGVGCSLRMFRNGTDFLCDMEGGEYDLVLLGAHMMGMDGAQAARELRELDGNVRIVFMSDLPEDPMEGDGTGMHWHLHKPADAASLFQLLDRAGRELSLQEGQGFVLKGKKGVSRIFFARIEYVEVVNKTVFFHLVDGAVRKATAALSDFEGKFLARPEFVKSHRAYLVNLSYVQTMGSHCLITENGHNIPVSRQRRSQVQEAYLNFVHRAGQLSVPDVKAAVSLGNQEGNVPWRVLLVDDDAAACTVWAGILQRHGCVAEVAGNGEDALCMVKGGHFDCVLLDVMIPGEDGFAICEKIRRQAAQIPVIFLSCVAEPDKQVEGFAAGGIDYITKDTSEELFWAKVEARIKLSASARTQFQYGPLCLDLARRRAVVAGEELFLAPAEFDMLWRLSEHAGRVFTPEEIFGMVFGGQPWDGGQMVQVHMSRLRRKLEQAWGGHHFIETVWGQGYRFVP